MSKLNHLTIDQVNWSDCVGARTGDVAGAGEGCSNSELCPAPSVSDSIHKLESKNSSEKKRSSLILFLHCC